MQMTEAHVGTMAKSIPYSSLQNILGSTSRESVGTDWEVGVRILEICPLRYMHETVGDLTYPNFPHLMDNSNSARGVL